MPLLDHTDYQRQTSTTLDSAGQTKANFLAASIISWAQRRVGFTFARSTKVDTFDGGERYYQLTCPVNVANVAVTVYNNVSGLYEAYASPTTVRATATGALDFGGAVPRGFQSVRVSYTAGWTDIEFRATDLHQALAEMLAAKFDAADTTGEPGLRRVVVGSYTEEYDTSGAGGGGDIPAGIMEVVDSYRPVFVF